MLWKDDRWESWSFPSPPIEIGGFKMIDVNQANFKKVATQSQHQILYDKKEFCFKLEYKSLIINYLWKNKLHDNSFFYFVEKKIKNYLVI